MYIFVGIILSSSLIISLVYSSQNEISGSKDMNYLWLSSDFWDLAGSSVGKESICNAGDPGSIPGSGRPPGKGIGYPLQHSWVSLMAQMVKNLPAMRETWVQSLGWEDSLEEGMATHCSILAWRISMDRGAWWATVHGIAKSQKQLSD